jgi:hypothetical protein
MITNGVPMAAEAWREDLASLKIQSRELENKEEVAGVKKRSSGIL